MLTAKRMTQKWSYWGLIGLSVVALLAGYAWSQNRPASAQDNTNLLTNGSLERPYYGQGGVSTRTAPQGWGLWVSNSAPDAFPHTDKVQVLDGEVSWNIHQGYAPFTAAGFQRVGGLKAGDAVALSAYAWMYTCNDTTNSCVIPNAPYRKSDTRANASVKVGIDPQGGTDPNAGSVVWSAPSAPYDQWAQLTVTATAGGDTVTVYLYATQTVAMAIDNVYWDKASLVRTTPTATVVPTVASVPFVVPQNVRPDGSIIHVVQAGDTLSSIAYAYSEYGVTNTSIAELNPPMKPNTRFLTIGQEIIILPPGSVDPTTGKLIKQGAGAAPVPTAAGGTPAAIAAVPSPTPGTLPPGGPTPEPLTPSQPSGAAITYNTVRASFVPFERGYMFWLEDVNQIYVLVNGATVQDNKYSMYRDTWQQGMPETDPSLQPPAGLFQPSKSFGQAWRTYPGVKDALGWAKADTQNFTALVVRQGNTVVLSGPDGKTYELQDTGAWQVIDYYAQ